ncbi:sulfotransferase [Nodosilinea sp. LEGE 07088]|uniref:sulfotransferase n=1 Tax=Nodosilinea sp. LEGE 07088 TaxID=2777968 RepID=UPI00187ECB5F|nr:sulfotransferase [Nodosilinea sp. LEGE 07088]MBE9137704.1 sulfotransferase [Nodosilinea sp. LEGE 07088]
MVDEIHFLGIGAPRSGTSWLHERLAEHPDFQLPRTKELHYFDRSTDYPSPNKLASDGLAARIKQSSWRSGVRTSCLRSLRNRDAAELAWMLKYYFPKKYDDQWYLSLFDSMNGIRGEITPAYMLLKDVDIARIYSLFPSLKTVFLMRDPIERTWSSYRKSYLREGRTLPDIESIINYLDSPKIVQRLNYLETLERYKKYSQSGKIMVSFLDAITEHPLATLQEIVTFLGGDVNKISEYCQISAVTNSSPDLEIPKEVKDHLCSKYSILMEELSDVFGGYCTQWLNRHFGRTISEEPVRMTLLLDQC